VEHSFHRRTGASCQDRSNILLSHNRVHTGINVMSYSSGKSVGDSPHKTAGGRAHLCSIETTSTPSRNPLHHLDLLGWWEIRVGIAVKIMTGSWVVVVLRKHTAIHHRAHLNGSRKWRTSGPKGPEGIHGIGRCSITAKSVQRHVREEAAAAWPGRAAEISGI
jgi:hypothetical protein